MRLQTSVVAFILTLLASSDLSAACLRVGVLVLQDAASEQRIWQRFGETIDVLCPSSAGINFEVMDRVSLDNAIASRQIDAVVTDPAHRGLLVDGLRTTQFRTLHDPLGTDTLHTLKSDFAHGHAQFRVALERGKRGSHAGREVAGAEGMG